MISRPDQILLAELAATALLLMTALAGPGGGRQAEAAPLAPPPAAVSRREVVRAEAPHASPAKPRDDKAKPPANQTARPSAPKPPPVQVAAVPTESARPASTPTPSPAPGAATVASSDLPDTGLDYRKARRALINKGFKPARVAPPECRGPEPSIDACWGKLVEFPEIEACWGKDGSTCTGWWVAPDGKVLKIRTGGERSSITDRHWATPGEIDELPKGWKP